MLLGPSTYVHVLLGLNKAYYSSDMVVSPESVYPVRVTFITLWADSALSRHEIDDIYFFFFSRKQSLTFYVNCLHWIYMNCQILFPKKKRNISKCRLLKILSWVLHINQKRKYLWGIQAETRVKVPYDMYPLQTKISLCMQAVWSVFAAQVKKASLYEPQRKKTSLRTGTQQVRSACCTLAQSDQNVHGCFLDSQGCKIFYADNKGWSDCGCTGWFESLLGTHLKVYSLMLPLIHVLLFLG